MSYRWGEDIPYRHTQRVGHSTDRCWSCRVVRWYKANPVLSVLVTFAALYIMAGVVSILAVVRLP